MVSISVSIMSRPRKVGAAVFWGSEDDLKPTDPTVAKAIGKANANSTPVPIPIERLAFRTCHPPCGSPKKGSIESGQVLSIEWIRSEE